MSQEGIIMKSNNQSARAQLGEIRFGYDSAWIDAIMDIHNKTEMKRGIDFKEMVNSAFQASFAVVTFWIENRLVACGRMISDGHMYSDIFDVVSCSGPDLQSATHLHSFDFDFRQRALLRAHRFSQT
jgi:hypothetical protein